MTKQTMIATAISIFAASSFVAASANAQVKCAGTNACKGQSACKGGTASPGKGQNACKGQGFSDTKDVVSCQNQGGKAVTPLRPIAPIETSAGVPVLRRRPFLFEPRTARLASALGPRRND